MGPSRLLGALPALLLATVVQASAQTAADFDEGRAWLSDEPLFDAFYPTEYEPLSDVLADRRVQDDTGLLVLRRGDMTLALHTLQMSYHHIAQGDIEGEPWLVSF